MKFLCQWSGKTREAEKTVDTRKEEGGGRVVEGRGRLWGELEERIGEWDGGKRGRLVEKEAEKVFRIGVKF